MASNSSDSDSCLLAELADLCKRIQLELSKVIVGQHDAIEQMLITLLAGGHCLLIGVPGLAKTLMIQSLAKTLNLQFSRIQFTPDLMPADITGTEVLQEDRAHGSREFRFIPGAVFANLILADEINRTPPKTQAALLEAMQERQVTAAGKRHELPSPFFVLATQNPIEQEGTYPLPEAQLDRFMLNILVDYPTEEEELEVVLGTTCDRSVQIQPLVEGMKLIELTRVVRRLPISESVARFAMGLARCTRPTPENPLELVQRCVSWGAGPRASQFLVLGAKARAAMRGQPLVTEDDILAIAAPVLRHRIKTNFHAEAEGIRAEQIIDAVLQNATHSSGKNRSSESFGQVFRS